MKKYEFLLKNLDCANCANKIQNKIAEIGEFQNVVVNFNTLRLSYEAEEENKERIIEIVKSLEPEVEVLEMGTQKVEKTSQFADDLIRLLLGSGITVIGFVANLPSGFANGLILIGYMILLFRTIKNAFALFKISKSMDENFLVALSCLGAYLIGERFEGFMVILLYEIGKILEDKAVGKTRKSISDLMNIKPEYANLKTDSGIQKVSPQEVKIGDCIIIKQGEKIPLDGMVINGEADLDVASLTGESAWQKVQINSNVLSGSVNRQGILEVKVTQKYENSTVKKILELVENATDKKAKTETFVGKVARIYTPIVVMLAILVAVFLPLVTEVSYLESIYRALIFLVVSCPCAIAISVPLSYFSGIGKASKRGILIKGSDYLDGLKNIRQVVFDKTGTLTKGQFEIKKVCSYDENYTEDDVWKYIALGESFSNHPIAKSILKENKKVDGIQEVKNYQEITGKGLSYEWNGKRILVGNSQLVQVPEVVEGTTIFLKIENQVVGSLSLGDTIKPETKEAIQELNQLGIQTSMFTGDNRKEAEKIARELGIIDVKAEMLPNEKYNEMEQRLKNRKSTDKVAFVGDGINDSPVLAMADIGFAMGGVGSESAIEAADVVLMTDDIRKIAESIRISQKTTRVIKQNLIFAMGIKVVVLILSAFGISNMWEAIFADVGVTLLTILNTLRIL